jgi:fatty-acyl-CoA synthase
MLQVFDAFVNHAQNTPNAAFVQDDNTEYSYKEAYQLSDNIADALLVAGCSRGDRIAILSRNSAAMFLSIVAMSRVGAVPVPLNVRLTPQDWAWIVADSDCDMVFGEADFLSQLVPHLPDKADVKLISFDSPDNSQSNLFEWARQSKSGLKRPQIRESDVFIQIYTSGPTGKPKGVVLTHHSSTSQTAVFTATLGGALGDMHRSCLQSLPLFILVDCLWLYTLYFTVVVLCFAPNLIRLSKSTFLAAGK